MDCAITLSTTEPYDKKLASVEDVQVSLKDPNNQFGAIISGSLTIRCCPLDFLFTSSESNKIGQLCETQSDDLFEIPHPWFHWTPDDQLRLPMNGITLTAVPLVSVSRDPVYRCIYGLVLQKGDDGNFSRIGSFDSVARELAPWQGKSKERLITVV